MRWARVDVTVLPLVELFGFKAPLSIQAFSRAAYTFVLVTSTTRYGAQTNAQYPTSTDQTTFVVALLGRFLPIDLGRLWRHRRPPFLRSCGQGSNAATAGSRLDQPERGQGDPISKGSQECSIISEAFNLPLLL